MPDVYDDEKRRTHHGLTPAQERDKFNDIQDNYGNTAAPGSIAQEDQNAAAARDSSHSASNILAREREAAKGNVGHTIGRDDSAAGGGDTPPPGGGTTTGQPDPDSDNGESNGKRSLFKQESDEENLYRHEDAKQRSIFSGNLKIGGISLGSRKRATWIGGGLVGAIISIVAGFFGLILPFEVPSYVNFLEESKYAVVDNAADRVMERIFTAYLTYVLFPGMRDNGCPTTKVSKNCSRLLQGEGPVKILWRKMSGYEKGVASIEQKLALHGVEIAYNARRGKYYMSSPSLGNFRDSQGNIVERNAIDMTPVVNGQAKNMFTDMREVSKAQVQAEVRRIFEESGDYKKLRYRFKIGNFLKKYGIIRCLYVCKYKKPLEGTLREKKLAAISWFNQRILEPRSQVLALYINCLISSCSDELTSDGAVNDEATNGEPMDQIRRDTRGTLSRASATFGGEKLKDMVKRIENLDRDGVTLHISKLAVEKLGGKIDVTGRIGPEIINKFLGPVGAILALARLLVLLYNGYQIKVMIYSANSALYVGIFEIFRTYTHETFSYQMDPVIMAGTTELLRGGPFNRGPTMEESPVFEQTFASAKATPTAAFMQNFLFEKAHAADNTGSNNGAADSDRDRIVNVVCEDGSNLLVNRTTPGATSNLVCPEMRLGTDNLWTKTSEFLRSLPEPVPTVVSSISSILKGIEAVSGFIESLLDWIPGVAKLKELINEWLGPFILMFMQLIIPNPLGSFPSGATYASAGIAGAEIGGSDAAHRLLGGKVVSPSQLAQIQHEERIKNYSQFAALPLRDRLFSKKTTYSLGSQIALNMPSNIHGAARQSFASLLGNPFGKLANSFGSLLALNSAYAAPLQPVQVTSRPSAFDVTIHGYPADDPFFAVEDYDKYWQDNCKDGMQNVAYNTAKEKYVDFDPQTDARMRDLVFRFGYEIESKASQVVNRGEVNGCFMLETLAKYDEPPANASGNAPTAGGANCTDVPSCAQALLDLEGTKLEIRPDAKKDLQSATASQQITACSPPVQLNLTLLQLMLKLSDKHQYRINNFISSHSCNSGFHPKGRAADIDGVNGTEADNNPSVFRTEPLATFGKEVMAALPPGGGLGQKQCFGDVGPTSGKRYFDDGCDHIHIDVGSSAP